MWGECLLGKKCGKAFGEKCGEVFGDVCNPALGPRRDAAKLCGNVLEDCLPYFNTPSVNSTAFLTYPRTSVASKLHRPTALPGKARGVLGRCAVLAMLVKLTESWLPATLTRERPVDKYYIQCPLMVLTLQLPK